MIAFELSLDGATAGGVVLRRGTRRRLARAKRGLLPLSQSRQCCDSERWRTGSKQWRMVAKANINVCNDLVNRCNEIKLERATRIEPAFSAWETDVRRELLSLKLLIKRLLMRK